MERVCSFHMEAPLPGATLLCTCCLPGSVASREGGFVPVLVEAGPETGILVRGSLGTLQAAEVGGHASLPARQLWRVDSASEPGGPPWEFKLPGQSLTLGPCW